MSDRLEDDLANWTALRLRKMHKPIKEGLFMDGGLTPHQYLTKELESYIDTKVIETVNLNRMELAKDIKHRHWLNDDLRDAYLDAVISVSEETLAELKLKGEKI